MTDLKTRYNKCVVDQMKPSAKLALAYKAIASELRDQGRHLGAAMCSLDGHSAAWAVEPKELCPQLQLDAINDLLRYLRDDSKEDWNRLLALQLLAHQGGSFFLSGENVIKVAQISESASAEYHAILSRLAHGHPSADALLMSGFRLRGWLDSPLEPVFPGFEVMAGSTNTSWDGCIKTYGMNSGFRALLSLADYDGAMRISQKHEHALTTPGLLGWSIASSAIVNGDSSMFADASAQFMLDTYDREGRQEDSWLAINQQLWAPYFMSRSHMVAPFASQKEAVQNLRKASDLKPFGWFVPNVNRYIQIVGAVRGLVDNDNVAIADAIQNYQRDLRLGIPSSLDTQVMNFFGKIQTLSGVVHGQEWFKPMTEVITLLDRLPIFTKDEKSTINSALQLAVPSNLCGMEQGWVSRTLASITDEYQLRRILLAIFQAEPKAPLFAQICHGNFEYGKDIVVLREDSGQRILWQYSVKIGPIKKSEWNKTVRPQLEEIFQVPYDSPEIPGEINKRVGVLLWNDHFSPHVGPIVKGWLKEQQNSHGYRYELMGIDELVGDVAENCLVPALRIALREEGLLP